MPPPRRHTRAHFLQHRPCVSVPFAGIVFIFWSLHVLPMVILSLAMTNVLGSACGPGEWQCGGQTNDKEERDVRCIGLNRFCDGIDNCEDGSDEPVGCTNCNRTFIGEGNVKYPIRVTGPFQRYLTFVCQIAFVAAGNEYGDFVELTFLSFQIGSLEYTRNQTPICQSGYLRLSEQSVQPQQNQDQYGYQRTVKTPHYFSSSSSSSSSQKFPSTSSPPVLSDLLQIDLRPENSHGPDFGKFCGSMVGRSVTYFSESSNVSVTVVVPSRASNPSSSFSLYLTYRFLTRPSELATFASRKVLPYLGEAVPGTYCDRLFQDCRSSNRPCTVQSPNFPGFYPRNITCHYSIQQKYVPEGHIVRIVLSQSNDYKISVPTGRASSTTGTSFLLSTDCLGGDIVRIYDGHSVRSPKLLEFCGSGALPEVISSSNEVLVVIYSAPYQLLQSSRVEIDVKLRFVRINSGNSHLNGPSISNNGRCSQTILGSRQRWGIVSSPNHSMPQNANCTFRFIGASAFDRIWLYFVSFFSLVEKRPTSSGETIETCSSKLELFDSAGSFNNSFSSSSSHILHEPLTSFCGDVGPKLCAHAAEYPPKYLPPRPCDVSSESYVSKGSEFTIRHRFLAPATEVVPTTTSTFMARYEFVDTRQNGNAIDHSDCDRRFDSRISKSGTVSNPKNVFLYGRGGKNNITCMYHFIGLPTERLRIILRKVSLSSPNSTCTTDFDGVLQKYTCKGLPLSQANRSPETPRTATLSSSEYWDGYSSALGCLCNISTEIYEAPMIFESLASNVKLNFAVSNMNAFDDFEDFSFLADYEFINSTICERGLRRHTGVTGEGVLSFQVPNISKHSAYELPFLSLPVRCRWLIEASQHKYIYLKFRGLNTSSVEKCRYGNRILVYLDPRSKPVANACVDVLRRSKDIIEDFDIFSHTWYNQSHGYRDNRDRLFVEVIANPYESRSTFDLHWLEVTKPFVKTQSGQTLRNVDCLFECPEIGACIDPELWCDGTRHCPSGYDESIEHCRTFPTAYVSSSAGGVVLIILLIVWIIIRRRRVGRRLKKKDIRRLPQEDCLNMESPVG